MPICRHCQLMSIDAESFSFDYELQARDDLHTLISADHSGNTRRSRTARSLAVLAIMASGLRRSGRQLRCRQTEVYVAGRASGGHIRQASSAHASGTGSSSQPGPLPREVRTAFVR